MMKETVVLVSAILAVAYGASGMVNGGWSEWRPYGACSKSSGKMKRIRLCNNPTPVQGGKNCVGVNSAGFQFVYLKCNTASGMVNGGWSEWEPYGACSKSSGRMKRTRWCDNPTPVKGGKNCEGVNSAGFQLGYLQCSRSSGKVNGGWGEWKPYGACSKSSGKMRNMRWCNNPTPVQGGTNCEGANSAGFQWGYLTCNTASRMVNGGWSEWGLYGACGMTYGSGRMTRTRWCNKPRPARGGQNCVDANSAGFQLDSKQCIINPPGCGLRLKKITNFVRKLKVVGGSNAKPGEWPWQVGLLYKRNLHCGGTLVKSNVVVTAAHCIDDPTRPQDYQTRVGDHDVRKTGPQERTVAVHKIYKHESFNNVTVEHDIAVLILNEHVQMPKKYVNAACLPTEKGIKGPCFATGWGRLIEKRDRYPDILQKVELPLVNRSKCSKANPDEIYDGMICAGYDDGGKDTCQGDSGGPLVCRTGENVFELRGVTSWGDGCAREKKYGVYTDVLFYVDWIANKLATHN